MSKFLALALGLLWALGLGAQSFQDNFSDGDFTANPAWGGNTNAFIVNASNQLQAAAPAAGTYYLSTPVAIRDTATWEFWVRMNFAPSDGNRTRIYLMANQADLTSTTGMQGYYVQLGENLGNDPVEIFRQNGSTRTSVFRSSNLATVANNPAIARLRITRSTLGDWSVWADFTGGTNYVLEGTFTETTYNSGSFMGVWMVMTATNISNFFFDDFLASPLYVDLTPPVLDSARTVSSTSVRVFFNEPLSTASANNPANYSLNNGVTVLSALQDVGNPAQVVLTTSALVSQTTYQLTVNNLADLSNNILNGAQTNFTYLDVQPAAAGDIIFNELMPDPSPVLDDLPNAEYVEFYNRSNKIINLSTLTYRDGSDRPLPNVLMYPGDYVLITPTATLNEFVALGLTNVYGVSSLSLTNSGRAITLRRASDGLMIDSVFYTLDWYNNTARQDGGWSLELIDPVSLCKGRFNWTASESPRGGTPGLPNAVLASVPDNQAPNIRGLSFRSPTELQLIFDDVLDAASANNPANYQVSGGLTVTGAVFLAPDTVRLSLSGPMSDQTTYTVTVQNLSDCLGNIMASAQGQDVIFYDIQPAGFQDLIFNELMIKPDPVQGLANAEYIELYNRSNKVIQLGGMRLSHQSTTSTTLSTATIPDYLLLPGQYVSLHKRTQDSLFLNCFNCLGVPSLPDLNNTAAHLVLRRSDLSVVDSIQYSTAWYNAPTRSGGGFSMELINPGDLCKEGANWRASLDPRGGTPATENSVFNDDPDLTPPQILEVRPTDTYQLLLFFNETPNAAAVLASSYSLSGGLNVILAENQGNNQILLSLDGSMTDSTNYTLTIDGVGDCLDNLLQNFQINFLYVQTELAARYDVLINEIMADPSPPVGLPAVEWLELYNRSNKVINLQGFQLFDNSSTVGLFPYRLIRPGEYLIICRDSDTALLSAFGPTLGLATMPSLNVSGDNLVIRNALNQVVDAVSYEPSWYGSSAKAEGGWTLERRNYNRPCEGRENWSASVNNLGGTPGQPNSILQTEPDVQPIDAIRAFPFRPDTIRVFLSEAADDAAARNPTHYSLDNGLNIVSGELEAPFYNTLLLALDAPLDPGIIYTLTFLPEFKDCVGNPIGLRNAVKVALPVAYVAEDLRINEVLFNPVTGGSDFVELYNSSGKVLNAADLLLANTESPGGSISQTRQVTTPFLIFPGDYIAFTPSRSNVLSQYFTPNPDYVVQETLPTYADGEGTVVVYGRAGLNLVLLDSFYYNDDFHSRLISDKNGVSLERIDLGRPTNDRNNWHSGATQTGYATPAYRNSAARDNPSTEGDWLQLPSERFSPDGDGFEDFLLINYELDEPGFALQLYIYNAQGQLVRHLVQGEMLALEGQYLWDGSDERGQKALVGIYIIAAEIYNQSGVKRRAKKTCVLGGRL